LLVEDFEGVPVGETNGSRISIGFTLPELSTFWYTGPLGIIDARDTTFQLFDFIRGHADLNASTEACDVSCSSMISPGFLGPVSHVVIDALIAAGVVAGGVLASFQSKVLEE
jgi:hypothetical protein